MQTEFYLRRGYIRFAQAKSSENVLRQRVSISTFAIGSTKSEMLLYVNVHSTSTLCGLFPLLPESRRIIRWNFRLTSSSRRSKLEAASRRETCALVKKIRSLRVRGKLPVQTSNNDEPPPDEEFLFHFSQGPRRQARRFLSRQCFCRNYYVTIAASTVHRCST